VKTFSGKRALIIGGTGGIGRALCIKLAEKGAELIIHGGSSSPHLENIIEKINKEGGKAEGFLLNLDDPIRAEKVFSMYPNIDILICAWGSFLQAKLESADLQLWRKMIDSNLLFPSYLLSLYLNGMIKQKWGRILLFGGTNTDTIRGFTTSTAYSAAKTALGVLAKSTALLAAIHGVSCNVICPGLTETEYCDERQTQYNRKKSPDGIALEPEQIAKTAMFILENPEINGAIIPVDKGLVL